MTEVWQETSGWFVIPPQQEGEGVPLPFKATAQWFLAHGGTVERPEHVHPIGFDTEAEANRAVARLNARDAHA